MLGTGAGIMVSEGGMVGSVVFVFAAVWTELADGIDGEEEPGGSCLAGADGDVTVL